VRARVLACAIAFSAAAFWAVAADDAVGQAAPLLRAEFWIDLEPVSGTGDPWPVSADEAGRRLLEEATWVFGGMLWGFEFEYAPLDRTRGIEERFSLKSLGEIARGDPRLAPGRARADGRELRAYVEYRPDEAQAGFLESYRREPWKGTQGIGKADLTKGWPGRRAAYEDCLREAVRSYLRSIEPNKPRSAIGRVVFERPPSIAVSGGCYRVQARARVELLELRPYVVY
jgi:hypothetical protein